ncbi:hypothetical protein MKW92_037561 [Papaver armeniacum]|nr:hypothetical protein MKW92_037561 [Papaver armeniacum]
MTIINKTHSLFTGGIEVFCNKVIVGSTSVELLFTSATRLFLGVVELYFCSVKILKLMIFVQLYFILYISFQVIFFVFLGF